MVRAVKALTLSIVRATRYQHMNERSGLQISLVGRWEGCDRGCQQVGRAERGAKQPTPMHLARFGDRSLSPRFNSRQLENLHSE